MQAIITNFHKLLATSPDINFWEVAVLWVVVLIVIVVAVRRVVKQNDMD